MLNEFIISNSVSKFRSEQVLAGIKLSYRCSSYKKYPDCDFQVQAIINSSQQIIVSTSSTHNHDNRLQSTRVPSPVRKIVQRAVVAKLTQSQVRLAIQNEQPQQVSPAQISSLLNYYHSLTRPSIYSVDDLRSWCHRRSLTLLYK
ncbi:unnamed protein product [Didymodactylos carnosus]|uniref:Uncharacterized protein n=1 Tax=Didymodactylos carnosus TaxID=1234261 RepID=A0A814SS77_9BILA|nr:unnamed protein product [Didymodactylos carnosus]CAF1514971.1 unnamed protein product [Didymodactylos carnosus]CAF3915169.1 unnamed protein product [Didymodactylos carnosus]CAF4302372.1 unnamed protein product [Didymodactylos carnosus]